jgi:hypothetical protein
MKAIPELNPIHVHAVIAPTSLEAIVKDPRQPRRWSSQRTGARVGCFVLAARGSGRRVSSRDRQSIGRMAHEGCPGPNRYPQPAADVLPSASGLPQHRKEWESSLTKAPTIRAMTNAGTSTSRGISMRPVHLTPPEAVRALGTDCEPARAQKNSIPCANEPAPRPHPSSE